jgi:hypothetical protein
VLTSAVGSASKRSLIVMFTVSGQVPCSGAQRQDKGLEVVSTAIHGGAAAVNVVITGRKMRKINVMLLIHFMRCYNVSRPRRFCGPC